MILVGWASRLSFLDGATVYTHLCFAPKLGMYIKAEPYL